MVLVLRGGVDEILGFRVEKEKRRVEGNMTEDFEVVNCENVWHLQTSTHSKFKFKPYTINNYK